MSIPIAKNQRFNSLYYSIKNDSSSNFNEFLEKDGPFIDEFQMYNSQGEPLFETLVRRIIDDHNFKIDNMEWIKKVSFNSEWAHDLLENNTNDNYHHPKYSEDHLQYMKSILKILDSQ